MTMHYLCCEELELSNELDDFIDGLGLLLFRGAGTGLAFVGDNCKSIRLDSSIACSSVIGL